MLRITLGLFVGALLWSPALCTNVCPDGHTCRDLATCCKTLLGYSCCPFPTAVCCSDLSHCCPSGYQCNLAKQTCVKPHLPWVQVPMAKKEAATQPRMLDLSITPFEEIKSNDLQEQSKVSVVHCDNYYTCPTGTTCCRHPNSGWSCCPYSPAKCCLDGFHCCPYGYNCDWTYQHCVKKSQRYPFLSKEIPTSFLASLISPSEDESSEPKGSLV